MTVHPQGGDRIFVPEREIFDRSVQTGRAGRVKVRETQAEGASLFGFVSIRIIFDNLSVVVAEKCVVHAERFKDVFGRELTKGHAANALDDDGQQGIARVAVNVFFSWPKIQVFLAREHRHDVVIGDQVEGVAPPSQLEEIPLIAKTARVIYEVAGFVMSEPKLGSSGMYLRTSSSNERFALLPEQDDRRGSKLFRHAGTILGVRSKV